MEDHRFCPAACAWFLLVSTFSMLPLLLKDGLGIATSALVVFCLVGCVRAGLHLPARVPVIRTATPSPAGRRRVQPIARWGKAGSRNRCAYYTDVYFFRPTQRSDLLFRLCMAASLMGCFVLSVFSAFIPSPFPDRWPDFWPVLVSAYSCAHFVAFAIYLNWVQLFCAGDQQGRADLLKKKAL